MSKSDISTHLPTALHAVATYLLSLLGSERPIDSGAVETIAADALRERARGPILLWGRSGDETRVMVGLEQGWLELLSTAMLGEKLEAADEGADDLLREVAAQAYGAVRSHLANAGTKLPELAFEVTDSGAVEDFASAHIVEWSVETEDGPLGGFTAMPAPDAAQTRSGKAGKRAGGASKQAVSISPVAFPELGRQTISGDGGNFELLAEVELEVTVELGRRRIPLADVLRLTTGSVIELEKLVGEPLEVYANGRLIAEGEAVVIDEQFGVRITNLVSNSRRAKAFI